MLPETKPLNTLCLHHNDTDGRASAAIVRRALGPTIRLYEMDYQDSIPLEHILTADKIIIVDFSLPREEMAKLARYHQLIWIDHHKTAIDDLAEISASLPGLRDLSEAACVLTWQYFFPGQPLPKAVRLIGDRDIWRWAEKDTGPFTEGLYQQDTRPTNDALWKPLLDDDLSLVEEITQKGKILRDARMKEIRRMIRRRGFEVLFEGFRTLVINTRGSGDIGQQARDLGYQVAYCYIDSLLQGEVTTFVTLYAGEVDVAAIAKKFGGGGHRGAAGFHFPRGDTPFPPGAQIEYLQQAK